MREEQRPIVLSGDMLRDAMAAIGRGSCHIAVVLDADERVVGVVSDGDVRRAILDGVDTTAPVDTVMNRDPVCARQEDTDEEMLRRMEELVITAMPVIDDDGRLKSIASLHNIVGRTANFGHAVIFAGGEGRRLRPLTESMPKPLVEIGGRPLIEHAVERLARDGVRQVHVAVNYMGDKIRGHLRDGTDFGTAVSYIEETTKLGTAGALALMDNIPDGPVLVMNGDILTTFDARSLFHFHNNSGAALTVGVVAYRFQIPFGVIETADGKVSAVNEKPTHLVHINAGVYAIEPRLLKRVPNDRPYDMTDLIADTLKQGDAVVPFLIHEHWIDIGTPGDLERAQELAVTLFPRDGSDAG